MKTKEQKMATLAGLGIIIFSVCTLGAIACGVLAWIYHDPHWFVASVMLSIPFFLFSIVCLSNFKAYLFDSCGVSCRTFLILGSISAMILVVGTGFHQYPSIVVIALLTTLFFWPLFVSFFFLLSFSAIISLVMGQVVAAVLMLFLASIFAKPGMLLFGSMLMHNSMNYDDQE